MCIANSAYPDQMPVASDLGLHYLQRPICPNTYGYYVTLFAVLYLIFELNSLWACWNSMVKESISATHLSFEKIKQQTYMGNIEQRRFV